MNNLDSIRQQAPQSGYFMDGVGPGAESDVRQANTTMQRYNIVIEETGESFTCDKGEDLLSAMRKSLCRSIPVGCCNGGCGACRILVISGDYTTRKMSRSVVSLREEAAHCVLACRTYPLGDVSLRVLGRKWQPGTKLTTPLLEDSVATTQPQLNPKRKS